MSGGGRRGEIRKRSAVPELKASGGTHNRKARRAAKARARPVAEPTPNEDPELIAARIHARFVRMRAEREAKWATTTEEEMLLMRIAESGAVGWDNWFIGLLITAVPMWAHRHFKTAPDERVSRAHALGEVIAYSQGAAAIVDKDSPPVTKGEASTANAFNAIAEGIAIGAYCPDGATFGGLHWTVEGARLRVTNQAFCASYPLDDEGFWREHVEVERAREAAL